MESSSNDEVLNATVAEGAEAPDLAQIPEKPFDPEEFRDHARKRITYWLLTLLSFLLFASFGSLFLIEDRPSFEHLRSLIELLLGPVIALVSAATGFYFGAQSTVKKGR